MQNIYDGDLESAIDLDPFDYISKLKKDPSEWEKIVDRELKECDNKLKELEDDWERNTIMLGLWEKEKQIVKKEKEEQLGE